MAWPWLRASLTELCRLNWLYCCLVKANSKTVLAKSSVQAKSEMCVWASCIGINSIIHVDIYSIWPITLSNVGNVYLLISHTHHMFQNQRKFYGVASHFLCLSSSANTKWDSKKRYLFVLDFLAGRQWRCWNTKGLDVIGMDIGTGASCVSIH